jgi:hypothetical protein
MTEPNYDLSTADGSEDAVALAKSRLRGEALGGAERRSSVEHADYEESRNPDTELRLDGEDESLYSDGLDVIDDAES